MLNEFSFKFVQLLIAMRSILFLTSFFIYFAAAAQIAQGLQFAEMTFDFGEVREERGPVMHEFVFTNYASRPVKIVSVKASCGCTTPAWTKETVEPGKTGFIQASYNPKGRPGYFNKTLTVITDLEPEPVILQIKGNVSTTEAGTDASFDVAKGNWKLKSASFNLGRVYLKDEYIVRDFPFLNGGNKPIRYTGRVVAPGHIKAEVTPETVAPGEKGHVKISYNGKLRNAYGFQSDNVEIYTDDEDAPVKSFTVYATLEDYFGELKAEEVAKAPRLQLFNTSVDFGRLSENNNATREITVFNGGKKDLEIKALQGNCVCVTASAEKEKLKPGESATIRIFFKPEGRSGTQQKSVTVYSNDPVHPIQRITLSAYVVKT